MTSLKPVSGGNIFCGPAIISAITGVTTDEAAKLVQQIRGNNRPVVGVYSNELEAVFKKLNYRCEIPLAREVGNTLFNTLCSLTKGTWAIVVPGHFVCVEVDSGGKRWFIDNHTKKPMMASAAARGMQRVVWIRRVVKE